MSQTAGRHGERFVSPEEQRERIEAACERDGIALLEIHEEMDVSGGKPLDQRPGLRAAVAAIEAGKAEVVAAAYFDRLFRSLSTQAEVIERVEAAGGQVLAVDTGQVSSQNAGQWLSGTMMGAVSEYFRRSATERSAEGQARAVQRGAVLWSRIPLGYRKRHDATLEPDPETVELVQRAFEMRANGVPILKIRAMLAEHGVKRSPRGVQEMLASRIYLGEINFGDLANTEAHRAIIDRAVWTRIQEMKVPRGRNVPSSRLLARLKVLRCGTCGTPMGVDGRMYRCPAWTDCAHHCTVNAEVAEHVVVTAVRAALLDTSGQASAAAVAQRARETVARAQETLDTAVQTFTKAGLLGEPSVGVELTQMREARDDALAEAARLDTGDVALTVDGSEDWDDLGLDVRRALIKALIKSTTVAPGVQGRHGSGAERVTVTFR